MKAGVMQHPLQADAPLQEVLGPHALEGRQRQAQPYLLSLQDLLHCQISRCHPGDGRNQGEDGGSAAVTAGGALVDQRRRVGSERLCATSISRCRCRRRRERFRLSSIGWKNWLFTETSLSKLRGYCATVNASLAFDGSVKPLVVDNICHLGFDLDQLSDKLGESAALAKGMIKKRATIF